jgi:hypothetical protein
MRVLETNIAVRIDAPSPLVGEGVTTGRLNDGWVRGSLVVRSMRREPLTRLRGVYHQAALRADPLAKPPSPTRGEGKHSATEARAIP